MSSRDPLAQEPTPADMWERMVSQGVPEDRATELVRSVMDDPEDPTSDVDMAKWQGLLATTLQGISANTSDELGAAVRSIPALLPGGQSPGEAFRENLGAARQGIEQAREENPVASGVSEVAGAIGTGVATGGGSVLTRPLIGGAIEGGVAGAGATEGDLIDRLVGGAFGAGAGAATGGTFRGLGRLTSMFRSAPERASGRVAQALGRGGVDLEEAVEQARPGETIMDVGGTSTRKLGRASEAVPSEGSEQIRESLTDRAAGAATRIKEELQEKSGLSFEDAVATVEDLAAQRSQNARPLYEAAYRKSVPREMVSDVLDIPAFQDAYERGRRIAQVEGTDLPALDDILAGDVDEVPVQAVDLMKRGLDDLIEARAQGASGIGRNEARVLRNRLSGLLGDVDEAVPEYAAARAQFAGDSAVQDAFERGMEDFRGTGNRSAADPRAVARRLEEMTPSEAEFYRRGALDAIRRDMASVRDFGRNPDVTQQAVGSQEMRERIRNLFETEDAFEQFMDAMRSEQNMVSTNRFVLGGSPTTRIAEEVADLRTPLEGAAEMGPFSAVTGPLNALQRGAATADRALLSRARAGTESTVNELAPLLTMSLSEEGGTLLERLANAQRRERVRQSVFGPAQRAGSLLAGGATGRASNR